MDSPFSSPIGPDLSPAPSSARSGNGNHESPVPTLLTPTEGFTVLSLLNSESPVQPQQSVPPVSHNHAVGTDSFQGNNSSTFVYQQPPGAPILWPLEHEQEAMLLQHYIENVALFFDMIDHECHFGVHVVQRAKQNSTLMNAILALSARHLSRTTDFDPYIADAYYQRCFNTLIPALNDNVAIKEESLLAATIILRLLEEMNISVIGSDPQGHLFGTQAIIRATEQSYAATTGPSFRQAIYWAAFRQELWIALMTQRAFQLHIFPADRSLEPANDSIWATRTIAHLGDVSNFVFGEGRHSVAKYSQLMNENKSWRTSRPDSFDPFFFHQDRNGSGCNFPDIRFHEKSHVMGTQYNTLAHMLLIVHDPTIPQLGPAHKQSRAAVDQIVQSDVRTLCGVAQSNAKVYPSKFVACFAIALVGDRFTMREDQERLRELWYACERAHGFPPTTTIAHLEESWGWHNR
ncbi:Nn.00g078680.m01.CDS01 [Neocucurbitaria sp. VM-36]